MAHKSKTQRAKAAERKQNKQDRLLRDEAAAAVSENADKAVISDAKPERASKKEPKVQSKQQAEVAKKADKTKKSEKVDKPKKVRFQFIHDVRAELKRVTWPSRTDVLRWSGVVVAALLFFGVYTALLDNAVVTPALVAITNLGA